jgi:predicted phage terminase large subunit-like protein
MKCLLMGVFWPCWVWTQSPEARWLFASYSQALSTRDSVKCRALISSAWYQQRWGRSVQLGVDQNQKTYFETTAGGWRLATSVGGRGTGEHPDFIVVDDPHNVVQSESDIQREAVLDWWDGTISTRGRSRGVRQIVIMQRLHERDLSGHILAKGAGWDHLCFPMRYEGPDRMLPTSLGASDPRRRDGELLWPALFPEASVVELERDLGSRRTAGQLQQRPAPVDGELFRRHWFNIISQVPLGCQAIRYWDLAGSEGQGDYTVGVLIARDQQAFYVLDVVRGRWSIHSRNERIRETARQDSTRGLKQLQVWIEQEPGASGMAAAQYLIRFLAGFSVRADKVDKAKELRWEPWAAQLEAGNVFLVQGDWNDAFIQEHLIAPNGRHDDQLDAASGAFNTLATRRRRDLKAWLDAGALQ